MQNLILAFPFKHMITISIFSNNLPLPVEYNARHCLAPFIDISCFISWSSIFFGYDIVDDFAFQMCFIKYSTVRR